MEWAGSTAQLPFVVLLDDLVWDIRLIVRRRGILVLVAASSSSPRPLCQTINCTTVA